MSLRTKASRNRGSRKEVSRGRRAQIELLERFRKTLLQGLVGARISEARKVANGA